MKINNISSLSFQRALSTKEKKEYSKLTADARKELGIEETGAIIFDFNAPSQKGRNIGIGTLNSASAEDFVDFLKELSGITKIQTGPQSELSYKGKFGYFKPQKSPYSGSTFSLGTHTIDLEKLSCEKYGKIIDLDTIKNYDENYPNSKQERSYRADYDYLLGWNKDGVLYKGLEIAYKNFKDKVANNDPIVFKLNGEFEEFKKNLTEDYKKDILFDILAHNYHKEGKDSVNLEDWSYTDRYLFSNKVDNKTREKRINEFKDEIEFYKFIRFIAKKQHMETKDELNKKGIELFGDCLVCFSQKEAWASPECFLNDWYTGGIDPNCSDTNGIQAWNSPALNYDKLGKFDDEGNIISLDKTGELLYRKFKHFMELYDGIRMDAFWQYVSPFIYNQNLEGKNIKDIGNKILKIMEKASADAKGKVDPESFVLELVGYNTEKGKALTKNKYPHVYSTAYAEYNENPRDLIEKCGYNDGAFTIGATNHDNDTLVNISRDEERRNLHEKILKRNLGEGYKNIGYNTEEYKKLSNSEKEEEDFRTAKFSEIFTTKKQYYTLPDFFGMSERINISGITDDKNWTIRMPENYEKFYYSQIQKGYGSNIPKAYQVALGAKNSKNTYLINRLGHFADILRKKGALTTKEADEQERLNILS